MSPKCPQRRVSHGGGDGHRAREVLGVCFGEWKTFFLLEMANLLSTPILIEVMNSSFF